MVAVVWKTVGRQALFGWRRLALTLVLAVLLSASLVAPTVAAPAYRLAASDAGGRPTNTKTKPVRVKTAAVAPVQAKPAPAPSACTPDSFGTPAAVSLAAAEPGMHQQASPTHYYRIYGHTPAQIERQIAACAPTGGDGGGFAGQTAYYINWSFAHIPDGSGLCKLSRVKVGLHLQTALPAWRANRYTAPGLAADWQSFINNLQTHEQGHAQLDRQYAQRILNKLEGLPSASCGGIVAQANRAASALLAELQRQNAAYDAQTHHGATQGAIIP